jgi:hypothetical protein
MSKLHLESDRYTHHLGATNSVSFCATPLTPCQARVIDILRYSIIQFNSIMEFGPHCNFKNVETIVYCTIYMVTFINVYR